MCFYIRNNIESATLWIAKKDIVCYKLLTKDLISPHQYFQYEYNKLVTVKIGKLNKRYYIFSANHAKNTVNSIILTDSLNNNDSIYYINKGLHSYSTLKIAQVDGGWLVWNGHGLFFVYKAIIPKGSEFYYNNIDKEYVSNQLIIEKLIK